MVYSFAKSYYYQIRHVILSLLLLISSFFVQHCQATTITNYAEMITPIITMVAEMNAYHNSFFGNDKKATLYHLAATTSSMGNKALFGYNNWQAKSMTESFDLTAKDCQVQGSLMIRDVTKLAQHLYTLLNQNNDHNNLDIEIIGVDHDVVRDEKKKSAQSTATQAKNIDTEYARKVIIIPLLKCITSIAVASTQQYATSWSGDQARFAATAAYLLTNLLEEYSNLEADSALNKPLIAAMCVNVAWILYEGYGYYNEQELIKGATQQGRCVQCGNYRLLKRLGCNNHACCYQCLQNLIQVNNTSYNSTQLHNIFCPHNECNHTLNRQEIEDITKNNPTTMQGFDNALHTYEMLTFEPRPFIAVSQAERNAFAAQAIDGQCPVMLEQMQLQRLACGHAEWSLDAWQGTIATQFTDHGPEMNQIRCPHAGCQHIVTRNELRLLADPARAQQIVNRYDEAVHDRALALRRGDLNREEVINRLRAEGVVVDICTRCGNGIVKNDGCNHMTCKCGQEFCYVCKIPYQNSGPRGHGDKMCGCGLYQGVGAWPW